MRAVPFGARPCKTCGVVGCLEHLAVEQDYPDSAWNVERHDYAPRCEDDANDCDCCGQEVTQ